MANNVNVYLREKAQNVPSGFDVHGTKTFTNNGSGKYAYERTYTSAALAVQQTQLLRNFIIPT